GLPSPSADIVTERSQELVAADRTRESNRAINTRLTASNACMSCHSRINPIGFSLEAFDELGQLRTQEIVYDDSGLPLATHPIDTSVGTIEFLDGTKARVDGPLDLVSAI